MFIDMHMHECTYSKDSYLKLADMVEVAKRRGLDGICITDHDDMGLKKYAEEYAKKVNFPIFVGIEFFSLQGDIVAFGIEEYPKERVSAQEFIDLVKKQGGICFSAHPFRNNNRGLGEYLRLVHGLDGVEVLNGSTLPEANKKAADYAKELGVITVGASDCHIIEKIGFFATYFPENVQTMEEFLQVFKSGNCKPAYYTEEGYQIWDMETPIHKPYLLKN
ncbi:PHP domain-containing protein [Faecalimonas sp.]